MQINDFFGNSIPTLHWHSYFTLALLLYTDIPNLHWHSYFPLHWYPTYIGMHYHFTLDLKCSGKNKFGFSDGYVHYFLFHFGADYANVPLNIW